MSMILDMQHDSLDELGARFVRPQSHANDVVITINGFLVWKPRAQLLPDEQFVAFFSGDYREVLEPDDPRLHPSSE
jgi:hypothetical protein